MYPGLSPVPGLGSPVFGTAFSFSPTHSDMSTPPSTPPHNYKAKKGVFTYGMLALLTGVVVHRYRNHFIMSDMYILRLLTNIGSSNMVKQADIFNTYFHSIIGRRQKGLDGGSPPKRRREGEYYWPLSVTCGLMVIKCVRAFKDTES